MIADRYGCDSSGGYLVPRKVVMRVLLAMHGLPRYYRALVRRAHPTPWARRNLRALRGAQRVNGRLAR